MTYVYKKLLYNVAEVLKWLDCTSFQFIAQQCMHTTPCMSSLHKTYMHTNIHKKIKHLFLWFQGIIMLITRLNYDRLPRWHRFQSGFPSPTLKFRGKRNNPHRPPPPAPVLCNYSDALHISAGSSSKILCISEKSAKQSTDFSLCVTYLIFRFRSPSPLS